MNPPTNRELERAVDAGVSSYIVELRTERDALRAENSELGESVAHEARRVIALRAKNAALREALEDIAACECESDDEPCDGPDYDGPLCNVCKARAALAGKAVQS